MSTIKSILEYNFTEEHKEALLSAWIVNWCGGEWAFRFDDFIETNIGTLPYFDMKKKRRLLQDLKEICYEHDADFFFKKGFYISNYKMARKVYKLFHWVTWKIRFTTCLALFILLCRYGKRFYRV
jgi:hypothetical protein